MSNQVGNVAVILFIILLTLGATGFYGFKNGFFSKQEQNSSVNTQEYSKNITTESKLKDYYSSNLKINLKVPNDSIVDESFADITIILEKGKILQTRVGTNFDSAKEYFSDLKAKNNLSPKTYRELEINGRDVVMTTLADPNEEKNDQKTYFIHDKNAIFTFYTSDEALYPILDQIVQSFEYKP